MDLKPKDLFRRVISFARSARTRRPGESSIPPPPQLPPSSPQSRPPSAPPASSVRGLEVAHRGGALVLRWSIGSDEVVRANALIAGEPVLCLRVVSFTKVRDDVVREVQDRDGIELEGECEIGEPPQRAIVALGVRVGDRFVSIAHHVI